MHPAAEAYVGRALDTARLDMDGLDVCELGSYDVNGSVRPLFAGCASYTGVDVRKGPGVDEVADAATFGKPHAYDVVVSTETLEHADDPAAIVKNAARLLKPGGLFILTAAGEGRGAHNSDGQMLGKGDTYQNIRADDLLTWLSESFDKYDVEVNERDADIYATARKAGK